MLNKVRAKILYKDIYIRIFLKPDLMRGKNVCEQWN